MNPSWWSNCGRCQSRVLDKAAFPVGILSFSRRWFPRVGRTAGSWPCCPRPGMCRPLRECLLDGQTGFSQEQSSCPSKGWLLDANPAFSCARKEPPKSWSPKIILLLKPPVWGLSIQRTETVTVMGVRRSDEWRKTVIQWTSKDHKRPWWMQSFTGRQEWDRGRVLRSVLLSERKDMDGRTMEENQFLTSIEMTELSQPIFYLSPIFHLRFLW